jgi:retron-type reverse transcriptase
MKPLDFLQSELAHAERHLIRIRRIQAQMQTNLEAAGLDEVTVYERLAANKAHRQLQRDESFYQQMWLRLSRNLSRYEKQSEKRNDKPSEAQNEQPIDDLLNELTIKALKPQPYRKPFTPGPNEKCLCGSGLKYKRCCGSVLRSTSTPTPQNHPAATAPAS